MIFIFLYLNLNLIKVISRVKAYGILYLILFKYINANNSNLPNPAF